MSDEPNESETRPSAAECDHRDMAGDSAIETLNEGAWCTVCGALCNVPGGV